MTEYNAKQPYSISVEVDRRDGKLAGLGILNGTIQKLASTSSVDSRTDSDSPSDFVEPNLYFKVNSTGEVFGVVVKTGEHVFSDNLWTEKGFSKDIRRSRNPAQIYFQKDGHIVNDRPEGFEDIEKAVRRAIDEYNSTHLPADQLYGISTVMDIGGPDCDDFNEVMFGASGLEGVLNGLQEKQLIEKLPDFKFMAGNVEYSLVANTDLDNSRAALDKAEIIYLVADGTLVEHETPIAKIIRDTVSEAIADYVRQREEMPEDIDLSPDDLE